ncbi:MAG: acyl-CoA reductase [Bacteroidales bacterium]|nr:acyl-CoA reductase [Bacteroidales bacterium]
MRLNQRLDAFARLGSVMRDAASGSENNLTAGIIKVIEEYHISNPWFTPDNVRRAVKASGEELTRENLDYWVSSYPGLNEERPVRDIAVIMAGNIPAVGFHDMMCVLLTGNKLVIKPSSKDDALLREIASALCRIELGFASMIRFVDGKLDEFDAVIATGSDNTARYFEYYFSRVPHLIRKNRTGIALLTGEESKKDIELLGEDVFSYFGLGCRNITKLYVPKDYNIKKLGALWAKFSSLTTNHKYASNYDYHKAAMIINRDKFTDTGFVLLKHDPSLFSPVAVLNYEETDASGFKTIIDSHSDKIQVITGAGHTPFGFAQKPKLWDYSDNIDTIGFLLK